MVKLLRLQMVRLHTQLPITTQTTSVKEKPWKDNRTSDKLQFAELVQTLISTATQSLRTNQAVSFDSVEILECIVVGTSLYLVLKSVAAKLTRKPY